MSAIVLLNENKNPTDERHQPGHGRQHLPLRHVPAHPARYSQAAKALA